MEWSKISIFWSYFIDWVPIYHFYRFLDSYLFSVYPYFGFIEYPDLSGPRISDFDSIPGSESFDWDSDDPFLQLMINFMTQLSTFVIDLSAIGSNIDIIAYPFYRYYPHLMIGFPMESMFPYHPFYPLFDLFYSVLSILWLIYGYFWCFFYALCCSS